MTCQNAQRWKEAKEGESFSGGFFDVSRLYCHSVESDARYTTHRYVGYLCVLKKEPKTNFYATTSLGVVASLLIAS